MGASSAQYARIDEQVANARRNVCMFLVQGTIYHRLGTLLVAQLVEALRYKPEGRGFDSRRCHCFYWHNPSGSTMVLRLTQPLTEMSTRNISWNVKAAGAWGWPYHLQVPIVWKSGSLNLLEPSGPVQVCNGIALPLLGTLLPIPSSTPSSAQVYVFDGDMGSQVNLRCWSGWRDRGINPAGPKSRELTRRNVSTSRRIYKKSRTSQRSDDNSQGPRKSIREHIIVQREPRWPPFYWGAERDVTLHQRCGGLQEVSDLHPSYDPLYIPMLLPHDELSWHLAVRYQGDATSYNKNSFMSWFCCIQTLQQGQCVLTAATSWKIISTPGFHAKYRNECA